MYYIYTIQNRLNLKIYIGLSKDYKRRWAKHKYSARCVDLGKKTLKDNGIQVIHCAMAKHGIDNFEFQVIEEFETLNEVCEAEDFWIEFFNTRNRYFGYNIARGGNSPPLEGLLGADNPLSPLTKEIEQEIIEKYTEEQLSAQQIAENYDFGAGPIYKTLNRFNINKRNAGFYREGVSPTNKLFTDEEEKAICERYTNEQLPITQLAGIYKCTESCVFNILKRHNTPILGNAVFSKGKHHSPETEFKDGQISPRRLKLPEEEIIRQYLEEKLSTTEIAKKYDTHRTTIIRLLERNKIEMRDRGFYSKGKRAINRLFSDEKEQEICQEYQSSRISTIKLAKKYKCDRSTISEVLKRHKIKIRSGKLTDKEKEEAYLSYLELGSARKVAEKYGVSKGTILSLAKSKSA
jgi:group I intron endonuclease